MTIIPTQTNDGSWTCFNEDVGEHYHNMCGAQTETVNIYIDPLNMAERLKINPHLVALDPFFGLGYNASTCLEAFTKLRETEFPEARLTLVSVEMDPNILAQIPALMDNGDAEALKIILGALEHKIYYQTQGDLLPLFEDSGENFQNGIRFQILVGDIRKVVKGLPDESMEVVFHDAFSPRKQPELWTQQLFEQYARVLNPESGTILTYSASAPVRHGMVNAGFTVMPLLVEKHKSGTLAYRSAEWCTGRLSELETALLSCRSGIPYEDSPNLDLEKDVILQNREEAWAKSTLPNSSSVHRQFGRHNSNIHSSPRPKGMPKASS